MAGAFGRFPQPAVRGERAVEASERFELPRQQREMHRLVGRDREEIADEILPHFRTEAPGHVEREVDRDEFDMRQRMPQRDSRAIGFARARAWASGWGEEVPAARARPADRAFGSSKANASRPSRQSRATLRVAKALARGSAVSSAARIAEATERLTAPWRLRALRRRGP